jgi:hypothetical protein
MAIQVQVSFVLLGRALLLAYVALAPPRRIGGVKAFRSARIGLLILLLPRRRLVTERSIDRAGALGFVS